MKHKPIQSQEEADKVFEFLVSQTAETLNIKRLDAEMRVMALQKSDLMKDFNPDDPVCKLMVDAFLTNPQWNRPEYQTEIERLEKTRQ